MKNIYFVITFLILTISSNAQSISGKIIDEETKEEEPVSREVKLG